MTAKSELAVAVALDSAHMHLTRLPRHPAEPSLGLWLCLWPHHSLPRSTAVWSAPGTATREVSSVLGETL